MKRAIISIICSIVVALSSAPVAFAAATIDLDDLLAEVRAGRSRDAQENQARLQEFRANRARQAQLLNEVKASRSREEGRSATMEKLFEDNDLKIIELERSVQERLGDLKELFGVLQQAAGDARGQFEASITQAQFKGRSEFMTEFAQKMGQTNRLASLEEIERLWFELQREMTESGKVVRFPANVVSSDGDEVQREVTRVGVFNVMSDGKYLDYVSETGRLVELPRQPQNRYLSKISGLEKLGSGVAPVGIDPLRGQLLNLLIQKPSLTERIAQGREVGYVIISLGIVALLVAFWRLFVLFGTAASVKRQVKNIDKPGNNPLGRVLKVYHDSPSSDLETLELKLGEQILKETPKLNRMLPFLKIIAVVAPLLGLLGTVTGMIVTFQAITLYGTGDPKLMAGGISTALVTTVLGLVVAIPTVFMHTLVATRAKHVSEVLQQQAAGMVAERSERRTA